MLIGLHKTLACSATIRMQPRVVLPHPGMLPSGSGIASPECSRRPRQFVNRAQEFRRLKRLLVLHKAARAA